MVAGGGEDVGADGGGVSGVGPRILTFSLTIRSKIMCLRNCETVRALLDVITNHPQHTNH